MDKIAIVIAFIKKNWVYIGLGILIFLIARKFVLPKPREEFSQTIYTEHGATISKADAHSLARSLYIAMEDIGTVTSEVERVRKIIGNNVGNLRAVYNAFGLRAYSLFGSPLYGWMSSSKIDLKAWLQNELSDKDYKPWKQMFDNAQIY